jgi:anaerobic selenocysteine-containing dehydrogenase
MARKPVDVQEVFGACPLCTNHCSIYMNVIGNTVPVAERDDITGLPSDMCPIKKGTTTVVEVLAHPDRLKHPLKRIGERGEGKWEQISWDEALDTVVEKLKECKEKYGPDRFAMVLGEPKGMEFAFGQRFGTIFGTSNVFTPGCYCGVQCGTASSYTFGSMNVNVDHEGEPKAIVIWGNNPLHTGGSFKGMRARRYYKALEDGARLAVVDVRKIDLVDPDRTSWNGDAELWVKPRPGSDGALAMGLMKYIIENGLHDKEYIEKYSVGFEALGEEIKKFTFDDVVRDTWVPFEQIEHLARLYAENKPAWILWGNALEQSVCALQTCRAVSILTVITGNVGVKGGEVLVNPAPMTRPGRFYLPKEYGDRRVPENSVGRQFKVAMKSAYVPTQCLIDSIVDEKPYQIKVAWVILNNPLITYPESKKVYEAFKKIDFLVVNEIFMTPTAAMADIVLPAATFFEHEDIGYWPAWFGICRTYQKLVDPPGEAKADITIINEVARRLDMPGFWEDAHESLDYMLEPGGITYKEFKNARYAWPTKEYITADNASAPFRTPSGKAEIYAESLKKIDASPIPTYEGLSQSRFGPEDFKGYPLVLTNAKEEAYMLSMHRMLKGLRKITDQPYMRLNPETAKKYGLRDGELAWIETPKGRCQQRLIEDSSVDPRVVVAAFGWWLPEEPETMFAWDRVNLNMVTDSGPPYDPLSGSVQLKGIPCRVYH